MLTNNCKKKFAKTGFNFVFTQIIKKKLHFVDFVLPLANLLLFAHFIIKLQCDRSGLTRWNARPVALSPNSFCHWNYSGLERSFLDFFFLLSINILNHCSLLRDFLSQDLVNKYFTSLWSFYVFFLLQLQFNPYDKCFFIYCFFDKSILSSQERLTKSFLELKLF